MLKKIITGILFCLFVFAQPAAADAPLKSKLGLSTDQAKVVYDIQAKHRKAMRSERSELHRESRKLRRARNANDSAQIAQLEPVVAKLEDRMRQRILTEDAEIRQVLNPEQLAKFESYIEERNNMVGSSRDVRVLKN